MSDPNQEAHGGSPDPNQPENQGGTAGPSWSASAPQPSSSYPPPPPPPPAGGPSYPPPGGPQYPGPGGPQYPPPGAPSYPPPGGPPPGWPPPGPPSGGGRGKGPIIGLIAAAVVGLLVLAAVGIWLVVRSDDSGSSTAATTSSTAPSAAEPTTTSREPTRRSRTTTPSPPPEEPLNAQLMGLLSAGHDASNCEPVAPAGTALATVDCGPSNSPGGPASTRYSLFGDLATLDAGFDEAIGVNEELLECPGSGLESPTTWHYTDTPDDVAGKVACGIYNGNPDLVWTNDEALLLVDAQGPDLTELHDWWLEFG